MSDLFERRLHVANGVGQDLAILGHQLEEAALRASCGSERVESRRLLADLRRARREVESALERLVEALPEEP